MRDEEEEEETRREGPFVFSFVFCLLYAYNKNKNKDKGNLRDLQSKFYDEATKRSLEERSSHQAFIVLGFRISVGLGVSN